MCTPEAQFALSAFSVVAGMQQKNQQADMNNAANEQAARSADKGLLQDTAYLRGQRIAAAENRARAEADLKRERSADIGEGLVSNWANPHSIMRAAGLDASYQMVDVNSAYDTNMLEIERERQKSITARERGYGQIIGGTRPTGLSLALDIAKAGTGYWGNEDNIFRAKEGTK